jgi:hypothetical protein
MLGRWEEGLGPLPFFHNRIILPVYGKAAMKLSPGVWGRDRELIPF